VRLRVHPFVAAALSLILSMDAGELSAAIPRFVSNARQGRVRNGKRSAKAIRTGRMLRLVIV